MAYKVLFDGNDSGIIQVVGCGAYVPLAKYQALTEELTALATEVDEANDRIGELVAESQSSLELLSIVTEERDYLITFIDKNTSLLNEIDELKAQLVAVKDGSGTGQSPCAKFYESVALRKDFDQLREHADKMKVERDDLADQVEALATNRDAFREAAYKAISIIQVNNIRLPQGYGDECLAELRAEAGRKGFVAGADALELAQILGSDFDVEAAANEHAATVRQGGAE